MERIKSAIKIFVGIVLIGFLQTSYAVKIDKIVAFGDSLSDNGNLYALTKRAHKVVPAVPVIPSNPPYYEGRFSNGENWLDIMSKETGLPLVDHAYGGAWAESVWESAQLIPIDIYDQVTLYIVENTLDRHKDRHLFVIWAGANDYLQGRKDVDYATTNTVNNIKKQIERLIYHGAHQLLLVSLPDLSKTPDVVSQGPEIVQQVKALTDEHNKKLAVMVKEQQEKNPKITIVLIDAKEPFDALQADPEKFQLKNVKDACYIGYFYKDRTLIKQNEISAAKEMNIDIMNNASLRVAYMTSQLASRGGKVCDNPDEYLFWDHVHPTRIIHHVIATLAMLDLNTHNITWSNTQNRN